MRLQKLILPAALSGLVLVSLVGQEVAVDATILLDGSQGVVSVSPEPIEIAPGDRIRWRTSGDGDGTFNIDFGMGSGVRGPFPTRGQGDNPQRGRYTKNVGATIVTEPAVEEGQWKYTITWLREGGQQIVLDPTVIVRR